MSDWIKCSWYDSPAEIIGWVSVGIAYLGLLVYIVAGLAMGEPVDPYLWLALLVVGVLLLGGGRRLSGLRIGPVGVSHSTAEDDDASE